MGTAAANNSVVAMYQVSETRTVVRRRWPSAEVTIERFMAIMSREKFSGKVTIELHQGGVRRILAEDSQDIPA